MNRVCARAREKLKLFGAKTNTAKRALRVLTVPLAACALMFGATSASAAVSDHTVQTVNPTGTTVNLFDYWVVDGDNDKSATVDNINGGINKGHQLKFNSGAGTGINKWTGKSGTAGYGRLRFVENQLVNGYPAIKAGTYTSQGENASYTDESLAYLFNNDSQNGKAVYNNVQGLFQLENGYYVYDSYGSKGNYAVYNSTTNSFNVYDKAGVYKESVSSENLGQFFPFDSAEKVFEERNGQLSPKPITDGTNDNLNHHFGMSMTTEFVQPAGGKTTDNKDMVFEFSGDDDVWVYIDGVLVGDLGGIHEKATLDINFATGVVRVGHIDGANGSPKYFPDTTIKAMFQAAGVDTSNFRDDTFRDSSKHKLSFFYLERGAGASNMKLKFNLTTLPSSEVEKINQNGEAVNGATFALYRSDGPNADWNEGKLIAQGETKDGGQLILQKSDGSVLSFDQEHAEKHDYFVLKEVNLPAGYRSSLTSSTTATPGELHLQYKQAATGTGGVVVAPQTTVTTADKNTWTGSRMWLNGGYLAAKETISLNKDRTDNKNNPISSGTTFAVVLKRTDKNLKDTDENAWTPVTGNPLDGYTLCSEHGIAGAVQAAKSADTSVFAVNTKGDYEVTVRSLPGDIEKYAAMMEDKSKSEYTVAVYHTTASSLAEATTENTSMVEYQLTNRQFSTVIHLTNVQNRLFVQKVDDLGEPVNGATFDLYKADAVTGDSPSTYAIKPGATPYDTVQANGMTYPYEIKGAACFPLDSVNHAPLIKGTYYLRESMSPDGYELNTTITKVIVDDSGVYVDAGDEFDDVRSMSGPGSLIASLAQFGSPDSIDNTLTHIKGKLQSATVDASGNLTWDQTRPAEGVMHMRYDKTTQGTRTVLRYVEDKGVRDGQLAIIYADTGINRMALYQEDDPSYIDDASKARTNLGTLQLNHLFTTATAVQYTDRRVARLQVTKTVTADNGLTAPTKDAKDNDLTFTFKFTLPESQKGYEAHVFEASGKPVGNSFRLKNGDTHSIKAGETIRVYDLKKDDNYSVSELTTKGEESSGNVLASIVNTVTGSADESVLPAGFSLVSRKAGGEEQSGTGNTIEGKIVALVDGKIPASNKLEFTNNYSASSVTLSGLSAKKVLDGRDWADGDAFTVKLTAEDGVPMPNGAKSKVSTVEFTKDTQTQTVGDITYKTATFGDITYTKPGTYIYTISEAIPGSDAGADGISYSAASYTATVMVGDNQAGALVVTSVKVVQECNDAGDDTKTEVADAIFTNRYDEHERNITIHAQKSLTDNAGTFPLAQNAFTFKLEGVGGYADVNAVFNPDTVDKSMTAPMPQGAEGNTMKVGNNADGTVTWPAISYTAKPDAGRAYVYKFAENSGSVAGMTYDGSVYYAVVRNAKKGAGIETSIEYYKTAANGSVEQLKTNATPSFTNIYSVESTSATLQGQKTLSGRDWNQGESYTFNLAAATDDASVTGLDKTTAQAVADGAVAINASQATATAPESGRVASFAFGTEAAPTVTFNRAGTFSFNITEDTAQDSQAGMSMDKHTARATVVVTDLDESGNHTGKLHVSSVTYANAGASDADKTVTDKAAFTNAYHATGTFAGITVSKTLQGRASTAGQFTFAVTGLWYNGVQTSVDGAEANLSNKVAKVGVSGAVVGTNGAEKLFARTITEQDLGHTFAYRIHENQPVAAGYTYDTGYTGDAIVLVKVLARGDDPAKLYTVTTVLKGAGVTELLGDSSDASALTDEKITELKQKPNTYVQQYDASEAGTVSFVNRYAASLDYGASGGIWIEKTLTYPKGATVFGSPKSTFRYIVKPADETSAKKVGITMDGKVFETANVEANTPKTVSLVPEGGLTFTQNDAGKTFTYTVAEIDDKATGYTYDKTVHTVKAVVADNGDGTLKVTTSVSKPGDDGKDELEGQWIYPSDATSTGVATVKFKNTYTVTEAATYTPSVTKVVVGADAPSKFTFAMTAADDVTRAAVDNKLITGSSMSVDNGYAEQKRTKEGLKNGEHYQLDFSTLTFNKPGTYKFAINELAANSGLGEWKYDQHVYTVAVTVTDEGGKLVARADGTTGSEGFIFTNSYKTSTSYELQGGLEIVKTLNGKDLHAGMFGFTVTADADSTEYAASTEKLKALLRQEDGKLTVTNDEPQADGKSYTDILGGLTFATGDAGKTFTYKVVENEGDKGGYKYDSTYWTVEIAVENRDNGSLYTVTTVKHYDADKVELSADEKTYSSENGATEAQVFFTNSYVATGAFEGLTAKKVMDSGDKIEADQYTFDLYAEKADGSLEKMDEGTTQASENGIATVDFGKVHFKLGQTFGGSHELTIDLAGAVNDGIAAKRHNADHTTTYSFNLVAKERLANLPEGVRPVDTSATCRVLLEVTDNNDGTLTSKVTYRNGAEDGKIVFHNTRDKVKTIGTVAEPNVDIDGQLLSVGDSYVYTINWVNTQADAAGNLVPASVTVVDELPTGVVFEAFEGENADKGATSGQLLTWNLGEQPAGSHGSVRVRVKITEDAVKGAQGAVGTVNNTATVTVGNKSYTGTTTNYVPKKSESDAQDSTESGVALGDELTYTIGYKNTENAPATVTITDAVPAGTEFVEFAGDHKDAASKDNDGNLSWKLTDVPAGKEGTVQFKVRVTEDAFKSGGASGDISNQASVTVGNNPAVKTNTTTDEVSDGRLTLSKTVTAAEGITAPNKAFTFKVLLYQADGATPLTSSFAYAGRPSGTNGTYVSGQIKSGDTIALKAGGSVTVTVPVGAHYEVQELDSRGNLMTSEDGFAVADKTNTQKGTVGQATQAGFTNIYSVESTKVENAFKVQKKISGRNWTTSDAFTMTLTAQGGAPMPKGAKDGVSTIALSKDVQVGNFGTIEYTKPGTYTYLIAEQAGDETALTFSKATYRAAVTVTDDGAGKLTAKTKIAQLTDDAGNAAERTVEAAVFTNIAKTGSLTVKKTVVGGDSQREFGFTVTLTDGDGEPVSGTFGKGESAVTFTDGRATFTLKHGGEKAISDLPVGANYTVTEDAAEGYTTTAEGAEGTVTEDGATAAFTNTYGTATEGRDVSTAGLFTKTLKGRDWAEGDSFQFTLTGEDDAPMPEGSSDGSKTVSVTAAGTKAGEKVAFDFGSIRYTLDDIKGAGFAEVGGKRVRAKTFTYTVREVRTADGSAIAGVAYDGHVATMTVTVTDDGSGNLTATTPAIAQASGGDFVNTYTTGLDYSARAGVRLSKTLSGRAMEAGQFAFTVTADAETAARLGLKTGKDAYVVSAADDGEADLIDLIGGAAKGDVEFTDADAGKTYSFTVAETKLGGEGYTNDIAPRTVAVAPGYDAATGKLAVTTTVVKDGVEVARSEVSTADDAASLPAPVTVAFQNSYEATGTLGGEGGAAINATKTLTGRAAAAGEFKFSVRDAQGNVVATASNRASGDGEAAGLAFSPIAYTIGSLEQMAMDGTATKTADGSWSIPYTVSEDTAALPAGVTATASSFDITVKVTDNGRGGLDVAVTYPEGSDGKLSFVNGYGTNEATVDLAGTKTLALGQAGLGLTQADIAGKYTFRIEPLDGAPAPVDDSGKTVTEAANDAAGNVELGHVTFRQPSDLDDAAIDGDGLRSKTFAYRVSESGSVDGVVNDAVASRTFTVKVVEDTNAGTLAAEVLPAEGTPEGKGAFEFTNTYGVNPTQSFVTDQVKVNKKLKGRDLVEGEFEFQLIEINADGSESIAATGKNAADGTVALGPVTYTAPGTHSYELREVAGTAGGVTYDRAAHRVRTTVTDAGNGTLTVKHELADAEGNPTGDDSVTFTNGYEAAPVTLKLGAAKVLKGAELKAGQFSFVLKSRDGKVMSTARNAADGSVTFDALTFKQAGTYTFTVSEVDDGQAHVTYDRAAHKIVVTVSDEAADGSKTGYLSAKVSYEGDADVPPVFTNSYAEEPGTPGTPENPGTPGGSSGGGSDSGSGGDGSGSDGSKGGMPDTGDRSLPVEALGVIAGIGALAVAGGAALYRRRR